MLRYVVRIATCCKRRFPALGSPSSSSLRLLLKFILLVAEHAQEILTTSPPRKAVEAKPGSLPRPLQPNSSEDLSLLGSVEQICRIVSTRSSNNLGITGTNPPFLTLLAGLRIALVAHTMIL